MLQFINISIKTVRTSTLGVLLSASLLVSPVFAQSGVTLNLKDADINTLIATVSEVTGRNFIIDPRVKAKVTVISSSPMSADSVYETFLAVLQVYGFAAIKAGDVIKIVPETNVRQEGGAIAYSTSGLPADEIVTRVIALENVPAAQLVPVLRPIVPQWGHLVAYQPSNMLIIADRAANITRLERIIAEIDRGGDQEVQIINLKHASATEVVRIITALAQQNKAQDPTAQPASVIADERTNSVIIGGDKSERQKYADFIGGLDTPLANDGGATQVIYLQYASAENLAPILEGYAQQADKAAAGATGQSTPNAARTGGESRIIADTDTNALVVTAAPKIMRQIRTVVDQLDIQRSQVMVETVIAEVSSKKSSQLGVDWAVFNEGQIAAASLISPTFSGGIPAAAATSPDVALFGLLGQGLNTVAGRVSETGTSFALLLKALQGDGETNILSAPTLLSLDNEEAEFSVGQEVPFLTGSFSNTGATNGSVNPFQTIERRDVGLTLRITPQINKGNDVKLKIELESSSLDAGSTDPLTQITNRRTITNTVSVQNGQTLVLGGLMDDQVNNQQSGVPFLSSIPLVGNLFRFRNVQKDKRTLMVFLQPTILSKRNDADYYTNKKYDYMRHLLQPDQKQRTVPLVGGKWPELPSWVERNADAAEPLPEAPQ